MELRGGERIEIADVIVMQMRDDHILDRVGIDADQRQRLDRIAQEFALARFLAISAV